VKIIVFGDIMGRIGREAVKKVLPEIKAEHDPDLIIANAENLAHGKGVTADLLREMIAAGIDFFTSGNHVWDRQEIHDIFADRDLSARLIRPANYPPGTPGQGSKFLTIGTKNVLVLNLLGRIFSRVSGDDPFRTFDEVIKAHAHLKPSVILVDFHAEATSEKVALGWHAAGRVTAVWGTHTHVPTRDERVLPGGTAYISDIGMCGARDGVIGVEQKAAVSHFLTQLPMQAETPTEGEAIVCGIVITEEQGRATDIQPLIKYINIH
jgi:hypothetical protein